MKYDEETLSQAVRSSKSFSEVIRRLGISYHSGGMFYHIEEEEEEEEEEDMEKRLWENAPISSSSSTTSLTVGNFDKYAFPLISIVSENMIAQDLVSVQPIEGPSGIQNSSRSFKAPVVKWRNTSDLSSDTHVVNIVGSSPTRSTNNVESDIRDHQQ